METTTINLQESGLLTTTLQRFTNETELRNGLLQEDRLPSIKY
jgi:hypothetical protein